MRPGPAPGDDPGWADPAEEYAAHGFDTSPDIRPRVGVSEFRGITGDAVHLVHDSPGSPDLDGVDAAVDAMAYPGAMSTNRL
ncbi:hypothetical protein [Nocardiopsis sp. CA-288880]|uniref:hypothetical protein n=1 Tax=Nocardiopsis sp. CA-288880 TaxID=3239995 RepID=UPI003D97E9A5